MTRPGAAPAGSRLAARRGAVSDGRGTRAARLTAILVPALWLGLAPAPGRSADAEARPELSFVVGRYQLIGRDPDSLHTYTGTARIEREGDRLVLSREIAGRTSRIHGVVRRAEPGEAYVLAFAWGGKPAMAMVCLVGGDLDNYARLTCQWGERGKPHRQPGMEAYFAQEPWQPLAP